MTEGKYYRRELLFALPAAVCALFLQKLCQITGGNLVATVFCSANGSIWELMKPVLLSFLLFSALELLGSRPPFKRFTAARALGLYVSALTFVLLSRALPDFAANYAAVLLSLAAGFLVSALCIRKINGLDGFFTCALFMLLLALVMFVSFTAYPPRLDIFRDPQTTLYGIIPPHFDVGAAVLSN